MTNLKPIKTDKVESVKVTIPAGVQWLASLTSPVEAVGKYWHLTSSLNSVLSIFSMVLLSLIGGDVLTARGDNQMPVGVRPLGMGSSFVAVADDANAIAWNPAGLINVGQMAINGMTANLHGIESLQQSYLSSIFPLTDRNAIGIDWTRLRFGDNELEFRDDRITFSYGIGILKSLSAGVNVKRVSMGSVLDGYTIGDATGFGFDVGLRYQPTDWLAVGFFGQDITNTKVNFNYEEIDVENEKRNEKDKVASRHLRFGMIYKPLHQTILALDLGEGLHLGAEQWIYNVLAVRGGLTAHLNKITPAGSETGAREPFSLSAGGTLRYGGLRFDYAYLNAPTLGDTHRFSMIFGFDYDPKLIQVDSIVMRDVLLSFYQQYHIPNPLSGELVLTSMFKKDLNVSVSVFIPEYMDRPLLVARDTLLPKAGSDAGTKRIPLAFQFNRKVERLEQDLQTEAEIIVNYSYLGRTRELRQRQPVMLRQMGKVAYREKLDPMVAFIDPGDPVAKSFATTASQISIESGDLAQFGNLLTAMKIYEALNSRGIQYQSDTETPFQSIYGKGYVVDETTSYTQSLLSAADLWYIDVDGPFKEMRYPRSMLTTNDLIGDCDDLSALYATLLEAAGVRTKLVDVGENVFLMFETSVTQLSDMNVEERLVVQDGGKLWIPIDIKAFGTSFAAAWRAGAVAYDDAAREDQLKLVDVHAAWNTYVRMHPPTAVEEAPLASEEVARRIAEGMDELAAMFNN